MTRQSDIVKEQARSFAVAARRRPFHAANNAKPVRTAAYQIRRY